MFEHTTEAEARKQILDLVADYCDTFHKKKEYKEGDRIPYASRVYDHSEMVNLVDSSLEFWLTSGRYTDEFEKKLAEYLGAVSYTHLDVYKRQFLVLLWRAELCGICLSYGKYPFPVFILPCSLA